MRFLALVLGAALAQGCAHLGNDDDDKLKITDTSEEDFPAVPFTASEGLADYKDGATALKAEWLACKVKKDAKGTILVMHSDRAGYEKGKFCDAWTAQTFLSQGYDVVAVNRPGYGKSTGSPDFSGATSLAAIAAGVKDAAAKAKLPKAVVGAWGYEGGATAAALYARKAGGLKFLVLGGGIYDYEDALKKSADSYVKKDIEALQKTGGNKAIEERSISYDVSGLPKVIAIYHGKQDTAVPPAQAKAFSDALESSGEYKVTLQIIEGLAHDIPLAHHRKILQVLVVSLTGAAS